MLKENKYVWIATTTDQEVQGQTPEEAVSKLDLTYHQTIVISRQLDYEEKE